MHARKNKSGAGQKAAGFAGKKAVKASVSPIPVAVPEATQAPAGRPIPVVGVGASAGGLEAFTALLKALPNDTGMAFVLVQHMDPAHESVLSTILSRATRMPVSEVSDGVAAQPNHVYVIPSNADMTIQGGILRLAERQEVAGRHLPIDHFFGSLAEDRKSAAIGIILSGTASDGTRGLQAIKAEGGLTFAQDEKSARHPGMPMNAVAAGCVDFVLPPEQIAAELSRISRHPYIEIAHPAEPVELAEEGGNGFRKICLLLRSATGVDFLQYKPATIGRRIARRMALQKIESLDKYFELLHKEPSQVEALSEDILINVTGFFRDPEAFHILQTKVLPSIIANKPAGQPVRAWVPGCSTGEEVYSIAILLLEALGDRSSQTRIQMFGTDISDRAIQQARGATYPEASLANVSPARLKKFFEKAPGGYQVSKAVRDMCVFARHDLTRDPPFSNLDLISCRNVLIYLGAALQKKTIEIFHYALRQGGYLFLGKSEALSAYANLFAPEDRKYRVYSRKPVPTPPLEMAGGWRERAERSLPEGAPRPPEFDLRRAAERILLDRFAPAAIVVDPDLQIVHFQGDTGPYLGPATGTPSFHLLRILRPELVAEIRAAIQKVKKTGSSTATGTIRLKHNESVKAVRAEVLPIEGRRAKGCDFLVLFQEEPVSQAALERPAAKGARSTSRMKQTGRDVVRLERELASTREYLRSVVEDHEATYEELKAANEEGLSSNEELQSTNEELETAKEELQSSNEELTTLNDELQNRNAELGQLTNDLSNLLVGVNIPIVILDHDLRIRRFTPMAESVLNLIPTDVGRPFRQIAPNLIVSDWDQLFSEVLDQLHTVEREVQDREGRWYTLRMRPYKTGNNKADGVLVALVNITEEVEARRVIQESEATTRALLESASQSILAVDRSGTVRVANRMTEQMFGYNRDELLGQRLSILHPERFRERHDRHLAEFFSAPLSRPMGTGLELLGRCKDGTEFPMEASLGHIETKDGTFAVCFVSDISARKQSEAAALLYQQQLQALAAKLITAQEESSKHLARELHDVFSQKLAVLGMEITALQQTPPARPKALSGRLLQVAEEIGSLVKDIHQMSRQLHPAILDDLGLAAALNNECLAFSELYGVPVQFTPLKVPERLPEDVSLCLYRVAQESLRNIGKHAAPTEVRVALTGNKKQISLVIEDIGNGFELEEARGKGGLGLISMDERVRLVGGTFSIQSQPGKGTRVEVRIPLPQKDA
jgi:two-component system, chemotaxis family, CheB/CheR fusion protein